MATKKISQLPAVSEMGGAELIPLVQDGTTKYATASQIAHSITQTADEAMEAAIEAAEGAESSATAAAAARSAAETAAGTATTKAGEASDSAAAAAALIAGTALLRHGTGAPDNSLGNDGDYYLDDTAPKTLYGPKAAGAWPAGASLQGAVGPTGRIPNIQSVTSAATVTPTFDNDMVEITAQAVALTLANPTGTPINGLGMVIAVKDNGTSQAITYGSKYVADSGVTLPSATTAGKETLLAMVYRAAADIFRVVAVSTRA